MVREVIQENKKSRFFKNVLIVLISNIFSVVAGVLMGFVIPKIMGVTEYGYYKTFTLYCSYIGVLHFGFIDGIYLMYAGQKYEELDKEKFRTYTRFLIGFELAITSLILVFSFLFLSTPLFYIFIFVALNVLSTNVVTYYEFITQVTMNFKRMSLRKILVSLANIASIVILFILYRFAHVTIYNYIYVMIALSINYFLAIWYVISYKDITFGKAKRLGDLRGDLFYFFKVGIPLLLSNLVAQMIFVVDQQFVNIAFDNDTYSFYAFAYNMISLITIATSAISVVLYPTLRTITESSITKNYSLINAYLLIFVGLCLTVYYPIVFIVMNFLSNYNPSLPTFLIILPGVMISSSISVIKYNCYKTFGKINNYFLKSITMLVVAIAADFVAFAIFKDTKSISIVSILVLLIWYLLVELYFVRIYKVRWARNFFYMLFVIAGFYVIALVPNILAGALTYLGFYIIVTLLFYPLEIKGIMNKLKNRKKAGLTIED